MRGVIAVICDKRTRLPSGSGGQDWRLQRCSFREWEPGEPVDLILTDPPYDKKYLDLYEDLPKRAPMALSRTDG